MTLLEWLGVVLPLLWLGWGLCLVAMYPEVIDAWAARLDAWWIATFGGSPRGY